MGKIFHHVRAFEGDLGDLSKGLSVLRVAR